MDGGGSGATAKTACRRRAGLVGKPWRSSARSGECGEASSRRGLGLLTIQLLGFLVERSDEFFVGSKRTVDIAGVDFGQTFCKLSIDDAALLHRVLVGRSRGLGMNADDATADLEFDLLAALKTGQKIEFKVCGGVIS